jgi:hypothetical protein
MDRKTIASIAGGVVVVVGIALGTGDDVKNEDGSAPEVVGVAVRGDDLVLADGTKVPIVQDSSAASYVLDPDSGPVVRVPHKAGGTVVETTDYTPMDVARQLALEPGKTAYRDLFAAEGVAIPPLPEY